MAELGRTVTHDDFARTTDLRHRLLLERSCVDFSIRRGGEMNFHIVNCRDQVFDGREALIEIRGLVELGDELRGYWLARLVMERKPVENLRRAQPMLVELARKFHEVPFDGGACERRIARVRVEAVQSMAELVVHGDGVVPRDKHRFSRLTFHHVRIIGYDGRDLGPELFLRAIFVHPGAGVLACACVGIEVPQSDPLTVALDLVDAHVGMINAHIVDLDELHPEELTSHPEHRLANLVELQVVADLGLIDIVSRLAHLLRVIAIVPRFDPDSGAFAVGDRLYVGDFFACARNRRLPYLHHQGHGRIGRFGHIVVQDPVRVAGKAQELGTLSAQLQDLGDHRVVVVRARIVAAHDPHTPSLRAQIAA